MMTDSRLSLRAVVGAIVLASPSDGAPHSIALQDRALSAMTDFRQRAPLKVRADVGIDEALRHMMHAGVRLLFVLDERSELVGLVSSYDIQGEKPFRFLQGMGCTHKTCRRGDVRVRDIMEPVANCKILAFSDVSHASVDDIVSAFKSVGRSHLVVVEPATGVARYTVRGLFSAAHVGRQLGMTLEIPNTAVTFAQIEMALSSTPALP